LTKIESAAEGNFHGSTYNSMAFYLPTLKLQEQDCFCGILTSPSWSKRRKNSM